MTKGFIRLALYLTCLFLCLLTELSFAQQNIEISTALNFPVIQIVTRPLPYADFCRRNLLECTLNGPATIKLTAKVLALLTQVNSRVNDEIVFALDTDQYNQEEYWALPVSGFGDCEDKALEKRSRLVKLGFPFSAMRLAIVSHKQFLHSHALLSIETDKGSYVMNSFTNEVIPWKRSPYNYESRERVDGLWDRYDQNLWTFDP